METNPTKRPKPLFVLWAVLKTIVTAPVFFLSSIQKLMFLRKKGIAWHLRNLLTYGEDGERIVFDHKRSGRFLQARKYVSSRSEYGIDLVVPLTEESLGKVDVELRDFEALGIVARHVDINGDLSVLFADIGSDAGRFEETVGEVLELLEFQPWSLFSLRLGRLYDHQRNTPVFGDTEVKGKRFRLD